MPLLSTPTTITVSSFAPCPPGEPCRFMPLGDSITEGYEGGYRVPLFRRAVAAGKWITFVGSGANGPETVDGRPFPRAHEGHGGYTIDSTHSAYNIADLVDASIATHRPHVIALQIGTNDVAREGFTDSPERLALLIDRILGDAPEALLVVARITPTQDDAANERVAAYNAAIPGLVSRRAAAGAHIALVDMWSAFTADPDYRTTLLYDAYHPNAAGDAVLARAWLDAVSIFLPAEET